MLNRRILRIKVFQVLYAYYREEQPVMQRHETFLLTSISRIEEMYHFILNLPGEIKYYIQNDANPEEVKYFPTERDIATGRTFVYNEIITKLQQNPHFVDKLKKVKFNWQDNKDLLRILFREFKGGKYFQQYLDEPLKDFSAQKRLMVNFFTQFLAESEDFEQYMEELSMHWQDDKKLIFNFLAKSIEAVNEENDKNFLYPLSEDWEEDWGFALKLFRKTVVNNQEYQELIAKKTEKWDSDRIAVSDLVLMKMALCEMIEFPSIPVKVTINEYLEISKIYSTPKSNSFLNGILDKIKNELLDENKIIKQGRGLVE